ncbi:MAG TPA: alpha/beta hydrolase [Steroidobacteraceae bacterium]|jgi:pimeloyl-ACP methyl ester carboxylesterase|nr:alpha/beta hydrolase [Steroidobacteraceae bacterium]
MRTRIIVGILLLWYAGGICAAADAIHEQGFVKIGGIEQWITIKGASRDNPVVLFIHGGPGNAMSAYADAMFAGWERNLTLVQWDQRGAGKTFGRSGPSVEPTLTIERMAMDGVEVAEYLTRHLHKKRIVLTGSSWGSLLGVYIVKRKPKLFYAYVGGAQLVNMRENFAASYRAVLAHARDIGDEPAIGELSGAGPPPWDSVAKWRTFRKWRNDYQRKVATTPPLQLVRSPDYTSPQDLADDEAADDLSFAHFNFVGTSMIGPMMDIDLKKLGPDFSVPVYVIHGAADLNAVPEIAREYVDWIKAPTKQFILVPGSGHADTPASLALLFGVLTQQVKAR